MPGEIQVRRVSKRFTMRQNRADSIKSLFIGFLFRGMREARHDFWALKDVTLEVRHGESLGLIGANGAGKSTLMYLMAGTMVPTSGSIELSGTVAPVIELGLGFHPELTGRENVYLNASLYGLTRSEIDAMFERILRFSELSDFIDSPVTSYSNGMRARLAFSIAVNLERDIVLLDEVLSVGDEHFSKKCLKEIFKLKEKGKTIVFVSHDMKDIRLVCDRVCLLETGKLTVDGDPDKVIKEYLQMTASSESRRS